ncbi:MAG: hypothetical protein A2Y08_02550 [Planctomycetes bacterium GWA2_40_7]|nr:MAG: hypothetical protein A2Y08_02550 [Planctomycetes bacterium GWA2_40_7]OHC01419.1 MAG: hypothetical protein A3H23_02485 [Planctomycetes bacterium RIFCSPLOWO2_12_FULL_40_19]
MPPILQDLQDILRGFKMTLDFNKLISAFVGIVLSILWVLVILAFASTFKLVAISPFELISGFLISPRLGLCSLISVLFSSVQTVDRGEYAVLIVLVLGLLLIWSVFAGTITRLAAVEFAKGEKIGVKDSLTFAVKKVWSYFCTPLMPVMGVLFFIACNVLGGLLGQIKFAGEIAVAIGFPLAILSGFLIVFIGIIGIIGFFLMYPTISAEGSDTFDAMSRAYSYVLSRPLHFLSLLISIIVCGVILTFLASFGACLVMKTTFCTVGIGMGDKFDTIRAFIAGLSGGKAAMAPLGSISMKFAALVLMLHIVLVKVVVGSIVVAFAGSASTIAYLILRKDVDGTEIEDVYMEEKEEVADVERKEEEAGNPGVKEGKISEQKKKDQSYEDRNRKNRNLSQEETEKPKTADE